MNLKATLAGALVTLSAVISGCGTVQTQTSVPNIVVQKSSQTVNQPIPQTIKLENAQGKNLSIKVNDRPVFFFAYWCPHCRHTMQAFMKLKLNQTQMLIFISTGSLPTDTLAELVENTNKDLRQVGIDPKQVTVLYLPGTGAPYISGYPDFIYESKSMQYEEVNGDITDGTYWEKVFSDIHKPIL